jgi:hypothetical protein
VRDHSTHCLQLLETGAAASNGHISAV